MIQDARRRETTNEKEHKIAVRDYIILECLNLKKKKRN